MGWGPAWPRFGTLAHYHGHTAAEIAKLLDLPLGTAKSRVYYGLRAMRQALQDRGYVQ